MKSDFKKASNLLVQIITVLVLFTVVLILLRRANLIKFPDFMEKIFYNEPEITSEYTSDGHEIFEYISSSADIREIHSYPEITTENMNKLLNSLEPYNVFYWESVSETYSLDSVIKKNCKSRISGKKYNVEILDSTGNISKKFISDGNNTVISKYTYGEVDSSVYSQGIFDFYSDAGLVSIDYFKDTDFSDGNCEIRLVNENNYNLVYIEYTYDRNGITVKNNYGISLDFGVVLFAQCSENDVPVYKQTTVSIYPLSSLDDKLFTVN